MEIRSVSLLVCCLIASRACAMDLPSEVVLRQPASAAGTALAPEQQPEVLLPPAPASPLAPAVPPASPVSSPASAPTQIVGAATEPLPDEGPDAPLGACPSCSQSSPWWDYWVTPCSFPPHLAYPPTAHGWYYFRPYNVGQVAQIQQVVAGWGGDPRNPYSNEIFQRVYTPPPRATEEAVERPSGVLQRIYAEPAGPTHETPLRPNEFLQRAIAQLVSEPETKLEMRPPTVPETKSESTPETRSESPPETKLEAPPETKLEAPPETTAATAPETKSEEAAADNPQDNPQRNMILRWIERLRQQLPESAPENAAQLPPPSDAAPAAP